MTHLSAAWFPRYPKPLTIELLGPCLHCGGVPQLHEWTGPDQLTKQASFSIKVSCRSCGVEFARWGGGLPGYPADAEEVERSRTLIATLWNGREACTPRLSFGEWQAGTVFTGGAPPEWPEGDPRASL